jgi:hypothetical protein
MFLDRWMDIEVSPHVSRSITIGCDKITICGPAIYALPLDQWDPLSSGNRCKKLMKLPFNYFKLVNASLGDFVALSRTALS